MLNKFSNRTMTRASWSEIRCKVRRHVLINSQQALEKRMLLSGSQVLMGGIVVKKQDMAVILCDKDNARYQARCAVPVDGAQRELKKQVIKGANPVLENAGADFLIYDFSGAFEVNGSLGDFNRDVRRKMYQVKEGDVVFVAGDLISTNCPSGYFILPIDFYSENELLFYRRIYSDRYDAGRKKINGIRRRCFQEPAEHTLSHARYPWDIVKLFLKVSSGMESSNYFWLESAANMIYSDTGDVRAARLVMKYYLIHSNMAKKSYIEAGNSFYPLDLKESFFEMYQELKDVVEWPEEN